MNMSAGQIVSSYCKGRLSTRPEYYAGRGNVLGDLDSDILEMVYTGVRTEIGESAAKAFVQMVDSLKEDASATTFLISLYRLEANDWRFAEHLLPRDAGESTVEAVSDAFKKSVRQGLAVGVFALWGPCGDAPALQITGKFLRRHRDELADELLPPKPGRKSRKKPKTYDVDFEW